MVRPRVTELWRLGTPKAEVLSGPREVAGADQIGEQRLEFAVRLDEQDGTCFITRAEAIHLRQLSSDWVQHALQNLVLRDGPGRVCERLARAGGLQLRLGDARESDA